MLSSRTVNKNESIETHKSSNMALHFPGNRVFRMDYQEGEMNFLNPKKEELKAENDMLIQVLKSAGISYECPDIHYNQLEYRTWLISQLKHVPGIIKNLRKENDH